MSVPDGVEPDFPLARLTTVRTGGPADHYARPDTPERLAELLAWADAEGHEVGVIGSGSNLLVADAGFRGLVMKLDGALAQIERDGTDLRCGGGARLPQASARAAREGLTGLEFGVNIPGTVGGAVKMNANAYGGDLSRVLEWVDVATPAGTDRRAPGGPRVLLPPLEPRPARDRGRGLVRARGRRAGRREGHARRDARAAQGGAAVGHQDLRLHLQEPRRRPRRGPQRGRAAGRGRLPRAAPWAGRGFSEKHANFVENQDEATTADVIALMAEGRRRVRERFGVELEPEVQTARRRGRAGVWES